MGKKQKEVKDESLDDVEDGLEDDDISGEEDDIEEEIFEERSEVAKQFESEEKEEITEERLYTVPLGKAYLRPPKKRAKKAIRMIREFFQRHMKADELIILPEVNERVWEYGIEKPPRRIKIRATKSLEGIVTLYLNE
jgi:large subunit ribosomal protein L31e